MYLGGLGTFLEIRTDAYLSTIIHQYGDTMNLSSVSSPSLHFPLIFSNDILLFQVAEPTPKALNMDEGYADIRVPLTLGGVAPQRQKAYG